MSHERLIELVSAATDDELSSDERAELDRLIQQSPEARRFRDEINRIDSILRKAPELMPPETLHERIMAAISLPSPRSWQRKLASKVGWPGSLTPSIVLRYGMATAAGIVLATVLYDSHPGISQPADITELLGTMAPGRDRHEADIVDTFAFRAEGIDAQLSLERRDGALLLDIRVDAAESVDISVDLAAAGARLNALAQTGNPLESIEITGHVLHVRGRGRPQLTALLHRIEDAAFSAGNTIELEFSSDGKLLQRGSLTPAW
jgi:anti-sigma factor RsiW